VAEGTKTRATFDSHFWEQSFDRLDDYLRGLQANNKLASRAKEKNHGSQK